MDYAAKGDIVIINYTISFTNGKIFDSTRNKSPLKFVLGKKIFIAGLEEIVEGMFIGQIIKKTIPEGKSFGPRVEELVQKIPISEVPANVNKKIGQRIEISTEPPLQAIITEITADYIVIDGNPIQAGKVLNVEVELLDIIRE